jgi:hypothetical protein
MRLTVRACRAPDAAQDCRRNALACAHVLRRYEIANITSAQQDWWSNHFTYALLLSDRDSGEARGGIRLQRWGNGVPLPLEAALRRIDPRVRARIAGYANRGVGELCGLWCSPKIRGWGLGSLLTCMGLALASGVEVDTVFGLCDTRNVAANLRLGFRVDQTHASSGMFEYPRPGLVAHVLRLDDARGLTGASSEARLVIRRYRESPVGLDIFATATRRLDLTRDLRLPPSVGVPASDGLRPGELGDVREVES